MEKNQPVETEIPSVDIPEITEVNRPEIGETTPHPDTPDHPQADADQAGKKEQHAIGFEK